MRFSIIVFCIAYLSGCGVSDQTERRIEEAPRPAKIITVNKNDAALTYEFPGRVEALQSVDISFEVGGPLSQLPIREGSTLPPGALVAAIDPTDFNLAVQEAQVQLRLAAQDLNRKQKVLKENGIAK